VATSPVFQTFCETTLIEFRPLRGRSVGRSRWSRRKERFSVLGRPPRPIQVWALSTEIWIARGSLAASQKKRTRWPYSNSDRELPEIVFFMSTPLLVRVGIDGESVFHINSDATAAREVSAGTVLFISTPQNSTATPHPYHQGPLRQTRLLQHACGYPFPPYQRSNRVCSREQKHRRQRGGKVFSSSR